MKTLKILSFMFMFSALVISCGDGAEAPTTDDTTVVDDAKATADKAAEEAKAAADKVAADAKAAADKAAGTVEGAVDEAGAAVEGAVEDVKEAVDEHDGHDH